MFVPSCSVSLSNNSNRSASPVHGESSDKKRPYSEYELTIMKNLNIDHNLARNGTIPANVQESYKHYVAVINAQEAKANWKSASKCPSNEQIATCFISKASWYKWVRAFQHVHLYPDMQAWLNEVESADPWENSSLKKNATMIGVETWCVDKAEKDAREKTKAAAKTLGKASLSKPKNAGKR